MGKQKDSSDKTKKTPKIPESAMVIPSSSDATQKTRMKGMTDLVDPKDGLNDSTQNAVW
ncbi:MAG: hypothetical protein H6Q61_875 [Firmicutes bacterium]|nr:hypothetical protein [Bacillota bacterium]